jgi:proteasome accessory factor A
MEPERQDSPAHPAPQKIAPVSQAQLAPSREVPPPSPDSAIALSRRVFGLETEYGFVVRINRDRLRGRDDLVPRLFNLASPGAGSSTFLENGGRLYLDTGSHPEYATPESDTLTDLVAHDKAGERIIWGLVQRAQRTLREEGLGGGVLAFKNNTDSVGNSYGCHENYLVRRDLPFETLSAGLIPFLVTRQVFAGSGTVLRTPRGPIYCVSQRSQHVCQEISACTTTSRAIINTRDEPHADALHYRRLHLVLGDSNMCEVTTYLKVGTTALVVDMLEAGALHDDYSLLTPVVALRAISRDPTLTTTVKLKDGRSFTALELQALYLEQATRYLKRVGADQQRREILARWTSVLGKLAHHPTEAAREVDWVIKRRWINDVIDRHGLSWADPRVSLLALQYHDLRPNRGIYNWLASRGLVDRITDDETIITALTEPPQTTRARLRGDCIRQARLKGRQCHADWSFLKIADCGTVHCSDPLQAHDERVERLIEMM